MLFFLRLIELILSVLTLSSILCLEKLHESAISSQTASKIIEKVVPDNQTDRYFLTSRVGN